MTRAYNRSSVALFTLVIPEQDLSGGIVTVASAEGYVGSVTLSGERESGPAPLVAKMRSEEHTSELQSLMRTSYAVFCLKKKKAKLSIKNIIYNNLNRINVH